MLFCYFVVTPMLLPILAIAAAAMLLRFAFLLLMSLHLAMSALGKGPSSLMAGAASAVTTPREPVYLAGYGGAGLSKGVHDELYAKAVFITDGDQAAAVLTIDCIGLLHTEVLAIRREIGKLIPATAFDPANLIVSSTHTHLGPDVVGLWGPGRFTSGVQQDYLDDLVRIAASTVAEAWKSVRPATATYGMGQFGDGWVYNISIPAEIDRTVTTMQFIDGSGSSIATLTNFACHPTIIGPERKLISADYVAGFYQEMDRRHGGTNLFLQGAIGGWVQPVEENEFAIAEMRGSGLARVASEALSRSVSLGSHDIRMRSSTFDMPVRSVGFKLLSRVGVLKRKIRRTVKTEVSWLRIGEAQFITHPGETSPYYGIESRRMMHGSGPKFVLGLSQDALGYLLKPEFFDEAAAIPHAGYLTMVSVGRDGGPVLMEQLRKLIGED